MSESESITCLRTQNLTLSYRNKTAFRDINLCASKHKITAVIGPSGCGKTSFLMCLNRMTDLIEGCHVSGDIFFGQQNVLDTKTNVLALRRNIGMIFQKPNPFPLSIWKNLDFPLKEHGFKNKDERASLIEWTLQHIGLWDEVKNRLHAPALALSGGQQQRLCMARAMVLRPDVLLMDEPCSSLDPLSSALVEDAIASLKGEYTVLIVTHNLAQAKRIADHTAFFWVQNDAGYLVEQGPTADLFTEPKNPLTLAYINGAKG